MPVVSFTSVACLPSAGSGSRSGLLVSLAGTFALSVRFDRVLAIFVVEASLGGDCLLA